MAKSITLIKIIKKKLKCYSGNECVTTFDLIPFSSTLFQINLNYIHKKRKTDSMRDTHLINLISGNCISLNDIRMHTIDYHYDMIKSSMESR